MNIPSNVVDIYENLDYDALVEAKGYRGPEVVFGLTYDFIRPGESLLDIGIGTGRASTPFYKAGLRISGIDLSQSMLGICRKKCFVESLIQHDLTNPPYPFSDCSMHHIISVGVLNHIKDLSVVFSEVSRILKKGGTFSFMVGEREKLNQTQDNNSDNENVNDFKSSMYSHDTDCINDYLSRFGFEYLRSVCFTVPHGKANITMLPVKAYVCLKR